jgi:sec-independent protein translocase protein TatC
MNKFIRIITAPFRFIWWLVNLPFSSYKKLQLFLNEEPEEHPIADTLAGVVQDKAVREALFQEIEAFRTHLLRSIVVLAVVVIISFFFTPRLLDFLASPLEGGIDSLKAIEVTESVGVFMRVAVLSGITISLPYIAFEFWLFFAPGLKPRSKKFGLVGIPLATLLFTSGMAFAFYIMMPAALPFLLNFMGIQAELRPQSYFNFITGVMFWIGVSFEFPLVIYVLTAMGFIKPKILAEQWRLAVVLIAILSAAITPTIDPVNMALVMAPMIFLYFVSIGLSKIAYRDREKQARYDLLEREEK